MEVILNEKNIHLDDDKLIHKWVHVLDCLKIKTRNRLFTAMYAEIYQLIEKHEASHYEVYSGSISDLSHGGDFNSMLPFNLKVLSKLNLDDKQIYSVYDNQFIRLKKLHRIINNKDLIIPNGEIKYQLDDNDLMISRSGIDNLYRIEIFLIEQLAEKINRELENGTTLIVDKFIDTIQENESNNLIILTYKYKII